MTTETFTLNSTTSPVVIRMQALNAKRLRGFVSTVTSDGAIVRRPTQIGESVVEWSFKPTLDVNNAAIGMILNADLPGANTVRRTISQDAVPLASSTDNPEDLAAELLGGGNLAQTIETFKFVKA